METSTRTPPARPLLRMDATQFRPHRPFGSLWASRDLVLLLAWRDAKVRYQHALIGIGWAMVQPLFTMLILTVFQRIMAGQSTSRIPYPLLLISAMVPWTFLVHAMTMGAGSLISFYGVIQKVYFPRLVLPLSAVLAATADFVVALPLIPLAMAYFGVWPGLGLLALPLFVLMTAMLAAAMGIWLAMLNVRYRDTANALPFISQLWFFLSPIAYSAEQIPERWRLAAGLNPMLGIIEGFRWSLFGAAAPDLALWVALSGGMIALLLATGLEHFLRHEVSLTDDL